MTAYEIIICANNETICDGYTDDRTASWKEEISQSFVDAAGEVIDAARFDDDREVDYAICGNFGKWHGGRHYKTGFKAAGKTWGYKAGLVVCHAEDCPKWLKDLCDKANQAACDARDESIAEYEAIANREDEVSA